MERFKGHYDLVVEVEDVNEKQWRVSFSGGSSHLIAKGAFSIMEGDMIAIDNYGSIWRKIN